MQASGPVLIAELNVPVDNGMFVVADPTLGDLAAMQDGLAEATESSRFVAVVRDVLTVVTPAEDSDGTPVTIHIWDRPPGPDNGDVGDVGADHEVELDFDISSGRLEVWLVGGSVGGVDGIPPGAYRARVSGRGFTPFDEFDGISRESYRLTLWPRTAPSPPVVTRAWPGWDQY
jgi:hypothetical protein